jgi:phage repressor protein C with HTH and peptisase S24 domain
LTLVAKSRLLVLAEVALVVMSALAAAARRAVVRGASMEPALADGDRVLLFPAWHLRTGAIVAVRDPRDRRGLLIKRVTALDGRRLSIEGDNPDSRVFEPVDRREVVGRAVYRYAPAGRVGPVGGGR